MSVVFCLWHVRKDHEYADDAKFIGAYSSEDEVRLAIGRLADQPGFKDHPDGFVFDPYPLNKDHWKEGFITVPINAED